MQSPAQPPVPRTRREQLAVINGSLKVGRGRLGKNGEQQSVIDDEHVDGLVLSQVSDLRVSRGHCVSQSTVGSVAEDHCDRGTLLVAKRRPIPSPLRLQLSGCRERIASAVHGILQWRIKMERAGRHMFHDTRRAAPSPTTSPSKSSPPTTKTRWRPTGNWRFLPRHIARSGRGHRLVVDHQRPAGPQPGAHRHRTPQLGGRRSRRQRVLRGQNQTVREGRLPGRGAHNSDVAPDAAATKGAHMCRWALVARSDGPSESGADVSHGGGRHRAWASWRVWPNPPDLRGWLLTLAEPRLSVVTPS